MGGDNHIRYQGYSPGDGVLIERGHSGITKDRMEYWVDSYTYLKLLNI